MHRTTTTATLLVAMAVTALSGCVTVQRPPATGSPAAPAGRSAPHPDGKGEPRTAQVPAHEALERVSPSRKPSPEAETEAEARHRVTPPPRVAAPPAPPRHARPAPRPEPQRPGRRTAVPPGIPAVPKHPDLCALGRKYGNWNANSPESVLCAKTYGN
ncbi:hypothetical protein [Streptomyces sp. NPDC058751]|uniref:hypothetical protein n=1 Tax=Streptomyces sp. NPDC058751 TaxID=3346623 RepID=UPI0036931419